MTWRIEFDPAAEKELKELGDDAAKDVLKFLVGRITNQGEPHSIGSALKGSELGELWKYRVGDYRIVSNIQDVTLTILVVRLSSQQRGYRR
ncbi:MULTISPECIES: type II toxin-antitoxin system RelE family toxin [Pseudomonas]|uniref:RelE/StbE family addiction module toxin n=2 Tax=Pseudomonas syringae group TaxID=136849 RepID=S6W1B6_PSESF|nr:MULTISPECIES: type II toxin-antitoxin system RelE/ParE family toxin [Pseudomonas]EPN57538.1 RelE/StbE family addiction module toxin [Pseudomonas syringae pv. actinidiae ICMP 18807]MBX6408876.1 type II toxin-antitoxin system RelE/ParE family toxin [Pseudomonas syringae pv. tomato]MBX6430752.1 type II toxin-antitoxin system RelE/ParE family toxin [Pseudomonas syringae pv. tomato]MBX6437648.1 type II toxin-antitoxin system RelE/ParE family toxin [Pseudomonas syringae pv. tomato]MBX6442940.1 ty